MKKTKIRLAALLLALIMLLCACEAGPMITTPTTPVVPTTPAQPTQPTQPTQPAQHNPFSPEKFFPLPFNATKQK